MRIVINIVLTSIFFPMSINRLAELFFPFDKKKPQLGLMQSWVHVNSLEMYIIGENVLENHMEPFCHD